MKILLIGKNGQLGCCIQEQFHSFLLDNPESLLTAYDSSELNITSASDIRTCIVRDMPDVIVNASAYTKVDQAESDFQEADRVNHLGVVALGEIASEYNIPIIHVSTDYVFDGDAVFPYKEGDETNPQSVYGKTKLAGELGLKKAHKQHVIIRTAWVFSEFGNNFVKTMLRLSDKENLNIVADQYGCPTYAGDLARCILTLCNAISEKNMEWGTYHFCGDSETSWHGFARTIFSIATHQGCIQHSPMVKVINTEEYPVPATRPRFSSLDCSSLNKYGVSPSNWRAALLDIIPKI